MYKTIILFKLIISIFLFLSFKTQALNVNNKLENENIDSLNIIFSHKSGFYNTAFILTIVSPDTTSKILYTLDGSYPGKSNTSIISKNNTQTILVDPENDSARATTPLFLIRVSILRSDTISKPTSRSYIFLANVYSQEHPGGNWPTNDINGQILHYSMSQNVVNDSRYSDKLHEAFTQIPSISITTDINNLFNNDTGIYVNALQKGIEWERPCSIELIYPDSTQGFSINAGLRIRGGASRHSNYPRHAFRLFFRKEYGQAKLNFPLFGNEGVSQFDKVDLRCAQNYSWANHFNKPEHGTLVREVFSRDTQSDMGQPYTRSRYYHLYLNGLYWGVYQTQERPEARFASDYFGDSKEDYDVVKVQTNFKTWDYQIEVTDGNLNAWNEIYELCNQGFSNNENYFKLLGLNKYGNPKAGGKVYVEIDNLIDYMLLIFYTGNFDSPASSFLNFNPNNFYAIYNRSDNSKGFQFFSHDAEHSLMSKKVSPGIGLNENRVQLPDMSVNDFSDFHPQWLHHKLMANTEYRSRFIDRVAFHFKEQGALSINNNIKRFNERVNQIDMAVIGESARWSDFLSASIKSKDDDWLPEIQSVIEDFFPYRESIVLEQMQSAGIWPSLSAPEIIEADTLLTEQSYNLSQTRSIKITNPNTSGKIYYTFNGNDPRAIGGNPTVKSIESNSDVYLEINHSTIIKARIYDNDEWSPIVKIVFLSNNDDYNNLKVTELHYHPKDSINGLDTISGKSFEFIEFRNTCTNALNLSGLVLDSAIYYMFPEQTVLAPGEYYVIATKPKYFYQKYGMEPSGNCSKFFSNSGEMIWLNNKNNEMIMSFTYSDKDMWPASADGDGYSLSSVDNMPNGDPSNYTYWRASQIMGGTPFSNDSTMLIPNVNKVNMTIGELAIYPNPARERIYYENVEGEVTYSIYLLNGKLVKQGITTNQSINISNLPAGFYVIKSEIGNSHYVSKLIKQ